MTRTTLLMGLTLLAAVSATAAARRADTADEQAIKRTVQFYFDGSRQGDSSIMRQAFRADVAHMFFVREGKLVDVPIPEFITRSERKGAPDFKADSFPRRVVMVDIAGTSAIAKLETLRPDQTIIDYMALLKIDGQWTIVNKIFDRLPRQP